MQPFYNPVFNSFALVLRSEDGACSWTSLARASMYQQERVI